MKKLTLTIGLMFFVLFLGAQNLTINGTITDSSDGIPIPGVNIIVKNTSKGTTSDFDGNFILKEVPKNAVLVLSYLGYKTNEVVVTNSVINIALDPDTEALEEVVVVGYGSQKKKEITGAVTVIGAETIEELKPTRVEQALQGQVSGVNITSQSGSPGSGLDIRIRGISTNGDARPLILIDGNVVEDLSVVNPNDIKSINVLKDATAGIYGVRAANGVIIIETKSGIKNSPLSIDVSSYVGFQETTRKLPTLNATNYALLANEAFAANGEQIPFSDVSQLGEGTNWQDEVFQKAPIISNSITLSGGGEKSRYSGSASVLTQDGIIGGGKSNFTRYTSRINYSLDVLKNVRFKTSFFYTGTDRKTLPESGIGSVLFNAVNMGPNIPVRDENGAFSRAIGLPIEVINPLAQIESEQNKTHVDKLSGVVGLDYTFLDHFKATVNYQWNYSEVNTKSLFPVTDFGVQGTSDKVFDRDVSVLSENEQLFRDYTFDAFINYDKSFIDAHNVKVTLGTSVFKTTGDQYTFTGTDLPETSFSDAELSQAATVEDVFAINNLSNRTFDSRLLSYFGRVQYDYKGKYLFTASLRRDGSTKFGPKNKFGFFPSGSLGWVVSDESFLSNSNVLNFFKLRGSFGILGNDRIANDRFVSTLSGEGVYVLNNQLQTNGVAIGALANPEIKWERQETLDIGFDSKLFNNKVSLTADYFKKTTRDLLLVVQTAGVTGVGGPGGSGATANAGTIENKGLEFAIGYKDKIGDNFSFNINYNFTTLKNNVLEVNNGTGIEEGGVFGIGQLPPSRMVVGQPIGVLYGLKTNGLFQTQAEIDALNTDTNGDGAINGEDTKYQANAAPGDIRFVDTNGDGIINSDDRTYIGDPNPDVTMGLNLSFEYKNFDFQTYLFASIGNDIVRNYERNHPLTNRTTYDLDRWRGPGTSNSTPRVTTGATSNTLFSDYYVEDGSFLRAQNLQLGYNLNHDKLEALGLKTLRFYVSVNNAFTLTKYRGFDPAASTGAPIGGGIDPGFYPTSRTYLLGVNLKL